MLNTYRPNLILMVKMQLMAWQLCIRVSFCIATCVCIKCDLSCREPQTSLIVTMQQRNQQELQHPGLAKQPTQHQAGKKAGLVAMQQHPSLQHRVGGNRIDQGHDSPVCSMMIPSLDQTLLWPDAAQSQPVGDFLILGEYIQERSLSRPRQAACELHHS